MFSSKLVVLALAFSAYVFAGDSSYPPGASMNVSAPGSPSANASAAAPLGVSNGTAPGANPAGTPATAGMIPGDMSSGQCMCPAPPTCGAPTGPAPSMGPSTPAAGPPTPAQSAGVPPGSPSTTTPPGPVQSVPNVTDSTSATPPPGPGAGTDNSTTSGIAGLPKSFSAVTLFTVGAVALAL